MPDLNSRTAHIPKVTKRIYHKRIPYLDTLSATYLDNLDKLVFDKEYIIEGQFEGFPELLSNRVYSTVDYWWIICLVNEIIDPVEDFVMGKRIVLPTLESIENMLTASISGNNRIGEVVVID